MTQVVAFFNGLVSVLTGLLLPASGTTLSPLQVLMWGALIFGFLPIVVGLIKNLASRGG